MLGISSHLSINNLYNHICTIVKRYICVSLCRQNAIIWDTENERWNKYRICFSQWKESLKNGKVFALYKIILTQCPLEDITVLPVKPLSCECYK